LLIFEEDTVEFHDQVWHLYYCREREIRRGFRWRLPSATKERIERVFTSISFFYFHGAHAAIDDVRKKEKRRIQFKIYTFSKRVRD
jgi:hypothetical protein